MPASDQYVATIVQAFEQAAAANRTTPGRRGNVVFLCAAQADEVLVAGDLHGHRKNFNIVKRLAALDRFPRRHLVMQEVCHGGPTYPGGGCMSHTLLEDVARLKVKYPDRVHFILSNHELAEMTDYPIQKNRQQLNVLFRQGLHQMYGAATERVREAYLPFLETCPLAVRLENGVFISHSIPENVDRDGYDITLFEREIGFTEYFERGGIFQLVWGRDYRSENARAFADLLGATLLVNGHEPCYEGFAAPNEHQVIVDGCADRSCGLLLPVAEPVSHADAMRRVLRLE